MTIRIDDRAKVVTTSPGTGAIPAAAAAAVGAYIQISAITSIANGDLVPYSMDDGVSLFEDGWGTWNSTTGLARTTVTRNSAGTLVNLNFNTGQVTVRCSMMAALLMAYPTQFGGKPSNRYTNYGTPGGILTPATTQVMFGNGSTWKITPNSTGRVRFFVTGDAFVGAGGAGTVQGFYGTGTPPVAGAAVPGGAVAGNTRLATVLSTSNSAFGPIYYEVTGLTLGTQYWFDLAAAQGGGGGISVSPSGVTIEEF